MNSSLLDIDSEIITAGHGSGGILTSKLLDQIIFKTFNNQILNERHDGATVSVNNPLAFTTDSYVITPLFFPGGDIGELAVNGTVNDLAMCGAIPQYLSLSFIIEEGLLISNFKTIVQSIQKACIKAQVQIVTGDTKVVEKGKGDLLFINTSGIGEIMHGAQIHVNNIEEDSAIIISHSIANHGVAILSVREGLEFETVITSDTTNLNFITQCLIENFGSGIQLLRDPTRGGVATVLNEIAEQSNKGIELDEALLPIEDQVNNACELLGLDPLFVANEGNFIAVVHKDIATKVVETIQLFDAGKKAAVIGHFTNEHPKKVVLNNTLGGKRIITKLIGEQLPRIC